MRSLGFVVLAGAITACPAAAQQVPEGGTVQGTVELSTRLSSRKPRVRLESGYGGGPTAPRQPVNELTNVVIYLETDSDRSVYGPAPTTALVMRQHHEAFLPHVLPVVVGSTVSFPNEDPFFHNVFSLSRPKTFDLGRYPTGTSKSVRFDKPGVVQVFCHIHSDMRATVLVLPNPLFVMPDSAGRFSLRDVPPGQYRLVAWHERIRPVARSVEVRANRTTSVELVIPLPPPAETATP
jgi:plastocyanin